MRMRGFLRPDFILRTRGVSPDSKYYLRVRQPGTIHSTSALFDLSLSFRPEVIHNHLRALSHASGVSFFSFRPA